MADNLTPNEPIADKAVTPSPEAREVAVDLCAALCGVAHSLEPAQSAVVAAIALALDRFAERRVREERERCAMLCDDRALGCRNIAETIKSDWMGPEIPTDDRRANSRDRQEHLARIPIYESLAKVIRSGDAP